MKREMGMWVRLIPNPRIQVARDGWRWVASASYAWWNRWAPGAPEEGGVLRLSERALTPWGARRVCARRLSRIRLIDRAAIEGSVA